MSEIPTKIENTEISESKDSIIRKAAGKINYLLSEIRGKIWRKIEKKDIPQEWKNNTSEKPQLPKKITPDKIEWDDGYDENDLPEYIRAIDQGIDPE